MRIRTFQGRSLEELLPQIREELGAGAVVLGQRPKVAGGIGGFFGTKVVEVTAADRMPSDDQLVDLEDRMQDGSLADGSFDGGASQDDERAERFAAAMGRRGGLDVTDTWDPSQDAELANEYGRVLEHAAAAGGFSELEVPVAQRTSPAPTAAVAPPAHAPIASIASEPIDQARMLAERAHAHMAQATARAEHAMAAQTGAYAPPAALPRAAHAVEERARTFAASVLDGPAADVTPSQFTEPTAADGLGLQHASAALQRDLAPMTTVHSTHADIDDAISAAVDMIDLKAMAALRNAMHASRRIEHTNTTRIDPDTNIEVGHLVEALSRVGVDDDVTQSLVDVVVRHRRPFGGEQDVTRLMRQVVEETIEVRSGFPRLGRAYRIALVGGSSSGKTTVAAKLALSYAAVGMRVGVVSIVAADPRIAVSGDPRFSSLDIDVRYAATPEQAAQAAETFGACDLVIVDTPGSTYLDTPTYEQVRGCLAAIGVDDVHVVVPLATSSREARSLVDAFRPLGANRLVVSRLDESRYIGQLLNFGFRLGVPMTFLSDGPRIPTDLRAASAREIAAHILPTSSTAADASRTAIVEELTAQ